MTIDATFTTFPTLATLATLATQRLRLRQIDLRDAEDVYVALSDAETMRFNGSGVFPSVEEVQKYILELQEGYASRAAIHWGITLLDDDRIIGACGLNHFDEGYHRAEAGVHLNRAYWGKSLMAEAATALLTYAFTEMDLHRVEATIAIANERSKNLLLRMGFQYEGNLRQRSYRRGAFEDEHYFSLLHDEWQARQENAAP